MSSVIIAGDTSGSVTLSAPAVSGTTTITLPATSGTLLQSGTAVTAAQGGTGLTAVGTSGNLLTSNGTAWVSSAPAAAGPVLKLVTDSTDIVVSATAPATYYNVGSSFSVSIPTTGIIRLASFVGRINNTTGVQGGGPTFGIRIGSTNYWFSLVSDNGTDRYLLGVGEVNATAFMTSNGALTTNAVGATYAKPQCLDIAYNSLPTGTQTVQLICAKTNASTFADNITIKGTTITTKIGIEFVSAS
jgi:hypothetical protein